MNDLHFQDGVRLEFRGPRDCARTVAVRQLGWLSEERVRVPLHARARAGTLRYIHMLTPRRVATAHEGMYPSTLDVSKKNSTRRRFTAVALARTRARHFGVRWRFRKDGKSPK